VHNYARAQRCVSKLMKATLGALTGAIMSIAAVASADAQSTSTVPNASVAAAFDGAMRRWMASHDVSRASVAVMRDNRLVFAAGYGGRSATERVAVWSLSKAVTAICIATLVQDKKLRFDDPIGPLLAPVFRKFGEPADERLERVTVAQLLSHRSGLPEVVGDNRFAPGMFQILRKTPPSDATVDMLMSPIMKLTLAKAPGSEYAYSNVGYLLLGQIIETLTGTPYDRACGDRVLAKAGIKQPRLDQKWGRLLQSSAGWALSGPEYLGFARLLWPKQKGPMTQATHDWLRSADGKWTDDRRTIAYTLGVRLLPIANAQPNIFHGGGWLWQQSDAAGGAINEKRGTWFVLTGDGVAWFASYDGVHGITDRAAVSDLQEDLWRARRSVASWPDQDDFPAMGVGPITTAQ
jgi:CubicO group peptidase (beta-lactamase class C family)